MNKNFHEQYDVRFCSCGRIHIMSLEYMNWIQEDYTKRKVIQVCQNCGSVVQTSIDEYPDGYIACRSEVGNVEIFNDPNVKVLLNHGIRVPLVGSYYADYYSSGIWSFEGHREVVDTDRLIEEVRSTFRYTCDSILYSISGYVSGINWRGTEFESRY